MPHSRAIRVIRGLGAAGFATFVALLFHMAGGGQVPHALGVLAPFILSAAASTLLAGRRLSIVRLVPSVILSQSLFHLLFTLGSAPMASSSSHQHGAIVTLAAPAAGAHMSADGAMWEGHAIAALVTIGAVHWGEKVTTTIAHVAIRVVTWLAHAFGHGPLSSPQCLRPAVSASPRSWLIAASPFGLSLEPAPRRGPPLLPA